jgi:hypothetical protein
MSYLFFQEMAGLSRVGKNPGFQKENPALWVFWVFLVFLGFFVFFARTRGFLGFFFSFTNTFRCIQTLNYNHSY